MIPKEINDILKIPEWDPYSSIKTNEASFIYDFILKNKIQKTLETGLAFGKSAAHIIAATQAKHVAIDPFQDKYKRMGIENIKELNFIENLEFYEDYSHNVLPRLLHENRRFEFIFIDGDHKFDGIFLDFYYADLLTEKGGYILFHDSWLRSSRLVTNFIKTNLKNYVRVQTPLRNFILFKKEGEVVRSGVHFREFYTLKSILIYNIIIWMTEGKQNVFKRIMFRIKEILK